MNVFLVVAFMMALVLPSAPIMTTTDLTIRFGATIAGILSVALFALTTTSATVWQMARLGETERPFRIYFRLRALISLFSLLVFGITLAVVGWGEIVRNHWGLGPLPLIDELIVLAPYLVSELLVVASGYPAERAAYRLHLPGDDAPDRFPSFWRYFSFHSRYRFGVVMFGVSAMILLGELVSRYKPWNLDPAWSDFEMLPVAVISMLISPLFLRWAWSTQSMPRGPVRERLTNLARRLGFRFSDILVWRTGGGVLYACVTGFVPQLRYVILSDALLERLTMAEIEAVFGHEIGHVRHRHMPFLAAYVAASVLVLSLVAGPTAELLVRWLSPWAAQWLAACWRYVPFEFWLLIPYFGITFGHISRRLERQADLFATRAASLSLALARLGGASRDAHEAAPLPDNPEALDRCEPVRTPGVTPDGVSVFVSSLEKVALYNEIPRTYRSWRYDSVDERIEHVRVLGSRPDLADQFDRSTATLCWLLVVGLIAAGFFLWHWRQ